MVVKDVDSVITCGAALAQMPKGEKHFANIVPCNTGLSSQSHCSHFQTKRGHFLHSLSHMRGTLKVVSKANFHPRHQHCTDEAQKAYIDIYIYTFVT